MKLFEPPYDSLPPRERILFAAHALFYREGIRATGVDKIIEQSSVSKVTFYRQYASKDELIRAYLDYRHGKWISWFRTSLLEAASDGLTAADALQAALRAWFSSPDFRGCAFLNAAAELGASDPEILAVVRRHKQEMSSVLDSLPEIAAVSAGPALSLVIDGAIVHVQMGQAVDDVMGCFKASVERILRG
ncbi:TetR/AcrR family transcriptional regulator [Comamonas testosteroni]|uniref:TetR/AcrR family transcriptional regulator n=1 Tax=Comamonas testosteroni TaxID=285 RepID=UPI002DB788EC|nr:TetR/AcrR family transcriptional regulator [Comamonas testosteroni]MEB5966967.1 TetR/AcrR family transcriptional regulator [Comamonas testosteroni]